ncbi:hypothetical protein [Rhodanobacter sp. T12-5]|uniref:hypothetical protein n=1 Tax=Rhodanobacter sp. T12-5 TaxID=2024611 RepID=UPI0011ED82E9|nr:hypothetical protein [Rhodanobacter sp. T12-5]
MPAATHRHPASPVRATVSANIHRFAPHLSKTPLKPNQRGRGGEMVTLFWNLISHVPFNSEAASPKKCILTLRFPHESPRSINTLRED